MASHTPNYGFNYFGPGVGGAITDEGGKFTAADRVQLDRMLRAFEVHDHTGGAKLDDPTASPATSLDTISGQLPGGLNVYYRISYLDQFGLETAASPEAVVATPTPLALPSFPILNAAALGLSDPATGLGTGVYTYGLTAINGSQETPLGVTAAITLDGSLPTVEVTFPDPQDGQTQWGVWRKGPNDPGYTKIDAVDVADDSVTDDGLVETNPSATDPSQAPPTTNATSSSNSITVEVPDPLLVGADPIGIVKAWRVYRTYSSGSYGASSLLAEVSTTVNEDGTGGLVLTFTDDGTTSLQDGFPLDVSQCISPSVQIRAGGGEAVIVNDGHNDMWRVLCATDGSLVTRTSGAPVSSVRTVLISPAGNPWVLSVDIAGALVTTAAAPIPGDIVYSAGHGPQLPCSDPTISFELSVADDGALVTTLY